MPNNGSDTGFWVGFVVVLFVVYIIWAASFFAGQNALLRQQCSEDGGQYANRGSEVVCIYE